MLLRPPINSDLDIMQLLKGNMIVDMVGGIIKICCNYAG
jgi:hypothetical protein